MSVSAVYTSTPSQSFDRLVPDLPSENAAIAYAARTGQAIEPVSDPYAPKKQLGMFQEESGPGFGDFLDMVNPLQHIPIINSIYREVSGDDIGVGARLAGGALFGGPLGLAIAAVNSLVEAATGEDIGGHAIAMFKGDDSPAATPTAVASADTPPEAESQAAPEAGDAKAVVIDLLGAAEPPPATAAPQRVAVEAAATAAAAPATPTAAPAVPAAEMHPMPVRDARLMPVPSRTLGTTARQVAAVQLPISNSSGRSNVPVTGVRNGAAGSVNPVLVQQTMAAQAQTTRNGAIAAPGATAPGPAQGWFQGAMLQALDKYDRSAKLGQQTAITPAVPGLQ
ncbi:MAG: hypothetical protein HYU60_01770 [Magnetospirillum sp.]|nr:hypothetical protein [Magnetospirillum sp.]